MQDNISVLIATIVFVILIVMFPIYNVANRQDSIASNVVIKATTSFVDDVRTKGYIRADEYQKFVDEINTTGNFFEVELEVHRKIIIQNSKGEYVDDYEIIYTEDILKELDSEIKVADGMNDIDALTQLASKLSKEKTIEITDVCLLNAGDKIYARVKNTNITQAQVLLYNLFRGSTESKILVNYGGEVYDSKWAKSDLADNVTSNISVSRPKNTAGIEYTMRAVSIGEEENEYIYGIGVPINSSTDTIRFDLRYTNIDHYNFVVGADNKVVSGSDLIVLEGFIGNVEIEKDEDSENLYKVLINNIKITGGAEQSTCYIRVKEGTATTKNGEIVGSAISPEFIIYQDKEEYDIDDITAIQTATNRNVKTSGYADLFDNKATVTFTAPTRAKDGRNLTGYVWNISNVGGQPVSIVPESGEVTWLLGKENTKIPSVVRTTSNKITVTFDEEFVSDADIQNGLAKGNSVKVRAIDENGVYSKTKGVVFATIENYMNKAVNGVIATVRSLKMSGATVDGATFNLVVSSGHGTSGRVNSGDRYRVIGIDKNNRQVILIDKTIEELKNHLEGLGNSSYGTQSTYASRIKYDSGAEMYYIDDNNNDAYDTSEYYLAGDISLSGFNTQLGFKTSKFNYSSRREDPAADDYSLYYWVYNSLTNLQVTINEDAKNKYTSLIFDYKIMQGHSSCLASSSKISCTVSSYFNE